MKLQTRIAIGLLAGIAVGLLARLPALGWFRQGVIAIEPVARSVERRWRTSPAPR
jgi:hypothetical protein